MSSATLSKNQIWQAIQHLNWSERFELAQLLLQALPRYENITQAKTPTQAPAIRGKYAFVPTSSEAFAHRKSQEIELEG